MFWAGELAPRGSRLHVVRFLADVAVGVLEARLAVRRASWMSKGANTVL